MSCTAVILAVLVCGLVSRANSIKCLSCREVARPRDCQHVQECGSHENCYIESYVTVSDDVRFNVGCQDTNQCVAAGRKRDILNATVLNEIQQKNYFGAVPEKQRDKRDWIVCYECCDTDLCNIMGCRDPGLPPNSGLLCYACEQDVAPDKCNKIELCSRDSSCHLSTLLVGLDTVYKSDCIPTHVCNQLGVLDIGAYQLVGRRGVDMISRFQRGILCNKCCSKNLCNSDNCTSVITQSTTGATTTQATATLAPVAVNSGWNTWSHWSQCSLSCGGGQQSRYRKCENPTHANSNAVCSGASTETQPCNNQLCTKRASPTRIQNVYTKSSCWWKNAMTQGDGNWSDWGLWSSCTATCGSSVTRSRTRTCTNPAPASGGANCIGTTADVEACNIGACQVDGQWALWTTWSSCSVTCGTGGISSRQRNCDNPRPSASGIYCIGQPYEIRQCSGTNGPQVIQSPRNFTRSAGTEVVINCLVHDSFPPQQVPHVTWTIPLIVGHSLPTNVEQYKDGSLVIHGLTAENCGPYACTLTTDCGSYDSPDFYVSIY